MFDNIGAKIKMLAMVVCWIEIIGSIIAGIVVIANGYDLVLLGAGIMLAGTLISWVGSFFIYGFGQLVDDTQKLREHFVPDEENVDSEEEYDDYDTTQSNIAETKFLESDFKIIPGAKCLVCERTGVPLAVFTMSDDNTPNDYICADCVRGFEKE